jgi:ribosomal protein S18 acetylase RimI-like enzyme
MVLMLADLSDYQHIYLMPKVQFREATFDDISLLQSLCYELGVEDRQYQPDLNEHWPYTDRFILWLCQALHDANWLVLILAKGNIPVGYLIGQLDALPPSKKVMAQLVSIYVAADYRGQEAGRKVAKKFEHWARGKGAQGFAVQVESRNKLAIKFYSEYLGYKTQMLVLFK